MDFVVTDREGIEGGILVRSAYVVISIHDPDLDKPKVKRQSGLRAVLQLAFDDAEPGGPPGVLYPIILMSLEQAIQIWQFVDEHRNAVDAVVVHCEAGMSRSPAVAAALCKTMGGDDQRFWREYMPNPYVYKLMLEAAGRRNHSS